ncbi:MAG: hypothetical protein OXE76_03925 [Alphaproteobacteria bacterium]|nr:hypothetical protein [Alphaproteobacteria bacterium]
MTGTPYKGDWKPSLRIAQDEDGKPIIVDDDNGPPDDLRFVIVSHERGDTYWDSERGVSRGDWWEAINDYMRHGFRPMKAWKGGMYLVRDSQP